MRQGKVLQITFCVVILFSCAFLPFYIGTTINIKMIRMRESSIFMIIGNFITVCF